MAFRLTPQLIEELLLHQAGIAAAKTPCVFALRAPTLWRHALLGPLATFWFRPYLVALDNSNFVLLELSMRLKARHVQRLNLAEIKTAVMRKSFGSVELIFQLRGGEKLPLRVANRAVGLPRQKSNLDTLLRVLEEHGLLQRSASHLKMLAAGIVVGLFFLGVMPFAVRYWFRTQTEAERKAIHGYLETCREAPPLPADTFQTDVLVRIETYKAPQMPGGLTSWLTGGQETYDSRLRSGKPVPPTLSHTLVADVKIILKRHFPESSPAGEPEVACALGLYLRLPWTSMPGYRPWTHWNFVRALREAERNTLARQIAHRLRG